MQETHSTEEDEEIWKNEWGGTCIYSHGTSSSRGVLIAVKPGFRGTVEKNSSDDDGRVVSCLINCDEEKVCVQNLYGPNKDSPEFFYTKINKVYELCERVVVIGDFNTVMNQSLDRNTNTNINCNSSQMLNQMCEDMSMSDIWRIHNLDKRRYSWYRRRQTGPSTDNPLISASRIDFALVSESLANLVHDTFYLNGVKSDHSAMFVGLELQHIERGGGYWKLNNALLTDPHKVQAINQKIEEIMCEYSELNPIDKWETLKYHVKKLCVELSQKQASDDKVAISQLTDYINENEERINELNEHDMKLLCDTKIELDELLEKKTQGILFRSKAKWYMEGERNTAYFYNLEKNRISAKNCTAVFSKSGDLVKEPEEILECQVQFYSELYTSDPNVHFDLADNVNNKLDENHIAAQPDEFSISELSEALGGLKNGSCPGSDGLTTDFYKVFWKYLKIPLHECVTEINQSRTMHKTGKTGVLNLIPKGNKDTRYLQNMRPITLLNTDYKIIEKCIANRMTPALCELIHSDQTGFLPGRRISANIRKILDVVEHSHRNQEENIVMSCDYMKCFDRIEIDSIVHAMRFFQFSEYLIKWIELIYEDFCIRLQHNGFFAPTYIKPTRGVHQGGPASNAIFLVVAELLAIAIREDSQIEGVALKEIIQLLTQYADDMDVCVRKAECLRSVLKQIEKFRDSTGFALNYDKTTIYRVGSMAHSNSKFYTAEGLKWTSDKINVLGVDIVNTTDTAEILQQNYAPLFDKCESILKLWSKRSLSLHGRVQIVNTLIASLFVYKMSVLPRLSATYINRFNTLIEQFIWDGRRPKIQLGILQLDKSLGGLQLVDIARKDDFLKAVWVKTVIEGGYPAEIPHSLHPIAKMLWCCNLRVDDVDGCIEHHSVFWKDVLKAWCRYHYTEKCDGDQIIWLNSHIRVSDEPVWWRRAAAKGLMYVSQLLQSNNEEYRSMEEVCKEYELTTMQFNALKAAIPKEWKRARPQEHVFTDRKFCEVMHSESATKLIYRSMSPEQTKLGEIEGRWEQELLSRVSIPELVTAINKTTQVAKLRSFQYRLLMKAVITNVHLMRWKMISSSSCSFCQKEPKTYHHLFVDCEEVRGLWTEVDRICDELCGEKINLTVKE